MAKYFNYFPKTFYNLDNQTTNLEVVTNIITRFSFESSLKQNSAAFYDYDIKDGDTPETIAYKYYNNVERHWIVLMFNDIVDPQYDWPLKFRDFNEYVDEKYSAPEYADTANTSVSGLSWSKNVENVHSYYKIITTTVTGMNPNIEKIQIDEQQYNDTPVSSQVYVLQNGDTVREDIEKETKTYYEYENELNESKRKIKLLRKEFAPAVEKEFRRTIQ